MAYQIFRTAKVRRQGVGGCQQEHNRTEKDVGRFPDSEIDYTRTNENIYLLKSDNYWEDIKKTLEEHGIEKWRKDAVVMNDAIYTASPEAMAAMNENERLQYFMDCAEWHQEHFGPIINAVIHMDETTPHLHIDSVPLVQKNDGTWKLSAKDQYGNATKLASLQTDLHNKVSVHYNLERGESRNPDEQRKHKTKLEHDIDSLSEKRGGMVAEINRKKEKYISDAKAEIAQKTKEAEAEARKRISVAQEQAEIFEKGAERRLNEKQAIEADINALKDEMSDLTGEKRAQELAREEKLKRYKKAPLSKDMYLVPGEDILAYENMGNTQRKLNEKTKAFSEKEKQMRDREQVCKNMEARYHEYPKLCSELREKQQNIDAHIHEEALDIFRRHYEGALRKMGIFEKVLEVLKKEKVRLRSHGIER